MENQVMETSETKTAFISPEIFLTQWQGHRSLTRRVIEAFPEDKLFTYSVGGMRPFGLLALEMIGMADPGIDGIVTGNWGTIDTAEHNTGSATITTKQALLDKWDQVTAKINRMWPRIPAGRFHEVEAAFGMYEGPIYWTLLYFVDNEIHHRGQGYVYLRSLGIEPPAFWER